MNGKIRFGIFVGVFLVLFAALIETKAQGGPSFSVTFSPSSAKIGDEVNIHIEIQASTYGASKFTQYCGAITKVEATEIKYDSKWFTTGCNSGNQTIQICAKATLDEQWMNANCQNFSYNLTGNAPSGPTAEFWADSGSLQPGQCTTMHWRTTGAVKVVLYGSTEVAANGDEKICPNVTRTYDLRAVAPQGQTDATRNFSVVVSTNPQPINPPVVNTNGIDFSLARLTDDRGKGIRTDAYCQAKGQGSVKSAADYASNAAYSWVCDGGLRLGDFNQVCREVWGSSYHAISVLGSNRIGTWRCVEGSGQQVSSGNSSNNTQPQNDNCGPSPSRLNPGQIAVVADWDDNPLNVFNTPDINSGRIFTVPIREMVSVISGPKCTSDRTWVEVGYQGKDGWAIEVFPNGYYNLIPNGMPLPGHHGENSNSSDPQSGNGQEIRVNPNQVPPTQVQPTLDPCATSYYPEKGNTVLVAWYPNQDITSRSGGWQCGTYVDYYLYQTYGFDLKTYNGGCTSLYTKDWVNSAEKCGLKVDKDFTSAQPGDVIIWVSTKEADCPPAKEAGHAAVVHKSPSQTNDGKVWVYDANHGEDGDIHTGKNGEGVPYPIEPCMSVIHTSLVFNTSNSPQVPTFTPNPPKQQAEKQYPPSSEYKKTWIYAAKIGVKCIKCNATKWDTVYVEFYLPGMDYVTLTDNAKIHSAYAPDATINWSIRYQIGPFFRFALDPQSVDQLVNEGGLGLSQLRTTSAWYITFKKK